ncbi:MAG: glycerol kinase GlpK [Anaerolineaceae bacterium]
MEGYILSIDQGTSGSKAIIFGHDGRIVSSAFHEITQHYPHQGWVEQDANEIWDKTMQAVSDVFRNARILLEDIRAIGISNQRCTTVVWNKLTGEPIGRAIIWQDRRTQKICDRISNQDRIEIEKRSGILLVPNISCTKIRWLMEEDRTVQKTLAKGELLFGTIDSWLIWKLSGGSTHATDCSNASTTGLLNATTLTYDDWLLSIFGIPREILPELKSSSEVYCYTAPRVFFGISIPVSGCVGDQPAAAFGQACYMPGMIKNTYGTGSFMILNTGQRHYSPGHGVLSPVLWSVNGKTDYGLEGYADVSGAVIQWLRDGLGIIHENSDADGLAMQVPDTHGVFFVPAFVGLGAPHHSVKARGTIFGLNLETNKNHITRAAIESIAYQTRDSLECIERTQGKKFSSLRVDGGGAKSDFLMQFQADILGIPIERPEVIETSAQGAAYLAGLSIGYWDSIEEIEGNWRLDTRFEPRMSGSKREDLYGEWLKAIECAQVWGGIEAYREKKFVINNKFDSLSPREQEVVRLIASEKSMREIASQFFTSQKTVEKQRRDAMRKLEVDNLAGLIRVYLEYVWKSENKNL